MYGMEKVLIYKILSVNTTYNMENVEFIEVVLNVQH